MITLHHYEREVSPERFTEVLQWLVDNFDFDRGSIELNSAPKPVSRSQCEAQLVMTKAGYFDKTTLNICRKIHFPDDDTDNALLYRLRFL